MPSPPLPPPAPAAWEGRAAALAVHSARLRAEIAESRQHVARNLDELAATFALMARRHPPRAAQLSARSQAARALAARLREPPPIPAAAN